MAVGFEVPGDNALNRLTFPMGDNSTPHGSRMETAPFTLVPFGGQGRATTA
ncbi:MAG: hypothetical protein ACC628_26805 [Pirellulaceae bacterium]